MCNRSARRAGRGQRRGDRRTDCSGQDQARYNGAALDANLVIVQAITGIADRNGASATQVALAWVLSRGRDVVPLVGSSRPAHVTNSAAAADLALTEADLARIDEVVPPEGAYGARYSEAALRLIDADETRLPD